MNVLSNSNYRCTNVFGNVPSEYLPKLYAITLDNVTIGNIKFNNFGYYLADNTDVNLLGIDFAVAAMLTFNSKGGVEINNFNYSTYVLLHESIVRKLGLKVNDLSCLLTKKSSLDLLYDRRY